MNERIKQFAQEAGFKVDWQHKDVQAIKMERFEKFTELIVKECARVLTQHGAYFSGEGEPYHYAASLIEEHFGVEE